MAKDVFFVLSRAWDKEKILSPHEESNLRLMGTQNFFSVPRSEPDEKKTSFYISLPSSTLDVTNVGDVVFD